MDHEAAKVHLQARSHDHQGTHAPRSYDIEEPGSLASMVPARPWRQGLAGHLVHWLNEKTAVMKPGKLDARDPRRQLLMRPGRATC
jgi:hypothetical protein